jgi:hypothetical protein
MGTWQDNFDDEGKVSINGGNALQWNLSPEGLAAEEPL